MIDGTYDCLEQSTYGQLEAFTYAEMEACGPAGPVVPALVFSMCRPRPLAFAGQPRRTHVVAGRRGVRFAALGDVPRFAGTPRRLTFTARKGG